MNTKADLKVRLYDLMVDLDDLNVRLDELEVRLHILLVGRRGGPSGPPATIWAN